MRDGVADERRERRLSRVDPAIDRIVILGDTGNLSLDAVRWCADLRISLVQIDRNGRPLLIAGPPARDDARLRRAQARAIDSPTGVEIARTLIATKLDGQARVCHEQLDDLDTAQVILDRINQLDNVQSLLDIRSTEAAAAADYFQAWPTRVAPRFTTRDHGRVPEHWTRYPGRRSPRRTGSRFASTDPVNTLLNYLYALAEIEARRACQILGLDPGLGLIHTDKPHRDSLALDLLETVRPDVDAYVLHLLDERVFTTRDFHETRDGSCRLLAPLTHDLAATMPLWAAAVAPHAEMVSHALAAGAIAEIRTTTHLTQARRRKAAANAPRIPAVARTCEHCGAPISARARQCSACFVATRPARATQQAAAAARIALGEARAQGLDPTQTPEARQRRDNAYRAARAADREWDSHNPGTIKDHTEFRTSILPGLATVRLSAMRTATGLSESACSMIRAGARTPHPRHWEALQRLTAGGPQSA